MFRFALISSLFAVAAAQDLHEFQRQLQLDLDAFQFNFGGININAELAQSNCPDQWTPVVNCVITKCPQFMEVCPDIEIPTESLGTIAPTEESLEGGNITEAIAADGDTPAASNVYVPTCDEIESQFCATFSGPELADCCLVDCTAEIKGLLDCVILTTTDEDRSDCPVPQCVTETDGTAETTESSNNEAESGSTAQKVIGTASATLLALAML